MERRHQLSRILSKFSEVSPVQGMLHAVIHSSLALILISSVVVFWHHDIRLALLSSVPLAIIYTAILVTTHDCIHVTYTGLRWFDRYWPVFWSALVYWPHHTYGEIHKLHHAFLGRDVNDPERFTYLKSEYEMSSGLGKFYVRHQWLINIFIFGGFGLIVRTWQAARKLGLEYPQLNEAMRKDLGFLGVSLLGQSLIYLHLHVWTEYLLCYLVIERVAGGLLQLRALAEHYGLWEARHSDITFRQSMSARNIKGGWFTRWLFNDLCFHSVHHVYPSIPWYKLGEAHLVIPAYWDSVNPKAIEPKESYGQALANGVKSWRLIDDL